MESIQWLMENGGVSIKLNLMNEGLIDKNSYDAEALVAELLKIEKVETALTYFDRYKEYKTWRTKDIGSEIHNCYENCYEMFMPFLIRLGFRAGTPVLDDKVGIIREIYRYLMTVGNEYISNVVMYLLEAGYYDSDMTVFLERWLDKIYNTAEHQCFDIYETDPTRIKQSKLPKQWKDDPILKDIHVEGELTVPTIYHIRYIIDIYKYIEDKTIKEKIDTILKYVMHPQFQKLRGNLGYGWFKETEFNRSAYYACSGSLKLPLYDGNKFNKDTLELMSKSPIAVKTEWYQNCIDYLEQYITERNTYMFPDNWFDSTLGIPRPATTTVVYDAFISKNAKIKRNEKRSFVIELLSTYYVLLMKKRMEHTK
ncbi:MAG: hypothetical protein FWC22_00015 [Treponema sp.]|nr:hypothetical protein [Treponema sp.]